MLDDSGNKQSKAQDQQGNQPRADMQPPCHGTLPYNIVSMEHFQTVKDGKRIRAFPMINISKGANQSSAKVLIFALAGCFGS